MIFRGYLLHGWNGEVDNEEERKWTFEFKRIKRSKIMEKKQSRREFLKRLAALSAGAIASPLFVGGKLEAMSWTLVQAGGMCGRSYDCSGGGGSCGRSYDCSGGGGW